MFSLCRLITLGHFVIVPEAEKRNLHDVCKLLSGRGEGMVGEKMGEGNKRDRLYTTGLVWVIST